MGFPAGMQLATAAFGIPLTATGKDVVTTVTVKPTARVIWAATGQPLPEFSDSFTALAGQLGTFQVPFVNQAGFIDSTGATFTDWAYQITAEWRFGNERPITWSKNFKPLVSQTGTIDLDLVPDGAVSIPVTAPTAAVLGFHGRTGFITIQESDLPTRLSPGELSATYASNKQVAAVTTPPVLLDATTTTNAGTTPRFIEYFDGYMWGAYTGDIYRSSDEGLTWTLYCDSWPGIGAEAFISRLVKTSDGEVLAMSDHEIRKSSGWANGNAATWSAKKITNTGTGIFNGFGLDGDGTKFILVEYSPTPASWGDSRYGYISLDSGNTWTARYDTLVLHGATANANSHLHGACYDATSGRFYVGEGHSTAGGVYYSSDNGLTWAVAPGMRISEGGGNYNAPTVITATDDGLVMGSDNGKNGLFGVVRQTDPMKEVAVQTWTMQTGRDGLVTFAQRGWRDPTTGVVYVTFRAEYNDTRPSIAAGTAKTGGLVYEWPTLPSLGGVDRFYIAAVTAPSRLTAYAEVNNDPTTVRGHLAAAVVDSGKLRGGRSSVATAVAIGPGAVATGATSTATGTSASATGTEATAYGAGAASASNAGTALGRLASAGEAGTAVGRGSSAGSDGTVVGYGANTTGLYGSALGVLAKAGLNGTAIGHTADASGFSNGVALGKGTVTTAADQVAVGDRDIEIQSLTKGVVIKSPDGTRWRIRVANGGALTTTLA